MSRGCSDNRLHFRIAAASQSSAGFSLVELLVTLGIIALLIALLMPAMNIARESAKQVRCASQLHQIDLALVAYAGDNRGYYPDWSDWQVYGGNGTGEDSPGLGWTEKIAPYIGGPGRPGAGIFHCPAFPESTDFNYFLSVHWAADTGRGALMMSEVKKSSEFILSADCTSLDSYPPPFGIKDPKTTQDCDKDDALSPSLYFFGDDNGQDMHRAGNNILFADGHVMPFKKFDIEQMTYHPTEMMDWESVGPANN